MTATTLYITTFATPDAGPAGAGGHLLSAARAVTEILSDGLQPTGSAVTMGLRN